MKDTVRVLIVDDSPDDALLIARELQRTFDLIWERVETAEAMIEALDRQDWDVVIADFVMPQFSGLAALSVLQIREQDLPFIIVSGKVGEDAAVEAMRAGAHDYIIKDHPKRLVPAIKREMQEAEVRRGRKRIEESIRRSWQLSEAIAEASLKFIEDGRLAVMATSLTENCVRIIGARQGFIVELLGQNEARLIGFAAEDDSLPPSFSGADLTKRIIEEDGIPIPANDSILTHPIRHATPFVVKQPPEDGVLPILDPTVPLPVANCLAVPMLMGNEQVGAIVLINKPPVFIEAEFKELETFAQTTALAIKGARTELERKKTMDQLRQAQKMEAIGQLAGGIAHDFNNLLTVINGYSTLLIRSLKQDEALKKEAEQILHAGERAADLTRQLLAFSRRQIIEPRTMSVNMQVRNLESMLCRLIGEHIELSTHLSSELGAIKADPGQIEQILLNLVVNARDALPNGGRITITTKNVELDENFARSHEGATAGRYVMLSISDNGQGMSEDVKRRIFEPFFTTKEQGKGTGLGLATVYGIVKQSKGYVLVESELGKGSDFSIFFPREDAPMEEEEPVDQEEPTGRDSTILVVEDEQGVLDLAVQTLKSHGFSVLQAIDPIAAQQVFDAHRGDIDLLLTDVSMPFMSGPDLANKLKLLKPSLKIAFFSGYADGNLNLEDTTAKGYPIISKPFTAATLVKKIALVIDRDQLPPVEADQCLEAI